MQTRLLLAGKANVHRPSCNCRSTRTALKQDQYKANVSKLEWWLAAAASWDIIHFNFGLHDLKLISSTGVDLAYEAVQADPAQPLNTTAAAASKNSGDVATGDIVDDAVKYATSNSIADVRTPLLTLGIRPLAPHVLHNVLWGSFIFLYSFTRTPYNMTNISPTYAIFAEQLQWGVGRCRRRRQLAKGARFCALGPD